ncbi:zf-HC2 domain-containing protein [Streptomyces aquilus]|uniref:RskA family anti-sigma factor n=1 Tax=Streptomyces aquilus TaxID=2548456 RepID=UPI0036AD571D
MQRAVPRRAQPSAWWPLRFGEWKATRRPGFPAPARPFRSECLNDHADLHTLTAAYALHALPEHELLLLERHLDNCPACRREVHELGDAVLQLATSQPLQAPAVMRARVLGLLPVTPQH